MLRHAELVREFDSGHVEIMLTDSLFFDGQILYF